MLGRLTHAALSLPNRCMRRKLPMPFMNLYSRFIVRYAGWISLFGLITAAVSTYYTVELYRNLRTDIEELLPTSARSVMDLNEVTRRLESIDSITVILFSKDKVASRRFVDDLAVRLKTYPTSTIAWVEHRIQTEVDFFLKRQALFLERTELLEVRDYVRDRIAYEKALFNPINIFTNAELPVPVFNFIGFKDKYAKSVSYYTQFPGGYYANDDETIRLLLAYLPGKVSGIEGALKLRGAIDESVASLDPKKYAPDLEVRFSGGVQNLIEEREALLEDLGISTVIVTILVAIGLLVYYRSFWGTFVLLVSLFIGTLWTLGSSYFTVGYLNANSAFLGSIIIGNGINFGIIFLARYIEERRRAKGHLRSVTIAIQSTATATLTAALAAGMAYGSLFLTDFRGFRQFGIIGFVGMVLCWISAYTILPALLTVISNLKLIERSHWPEPKHIVTGLIARLVEKRSGLLITLSVIASAMSILAIVLSKTEIIETNLLKLRNRQSLESGSVYYSKFVDQVFKRYMTPIVFLPENQEEARIIYQKLKAKRKAEGEKTLIDVLSFLEDFVPKHQPEKIQILKEIKAMLTPRIMSQISEQDRITVQRYLTPEVFTTFTAEDLPALLLNRFREKDGTLGRLVLVEPPVGGRMGEADTLIRFVSDLRAIADETEAGIPVAGQLPVSADMIEAIRDNGPKATFFAFIAVTVLVFILFRDFRVSGVVLTSLWVGVLWLFGLIYGLDLKINFLNFIALPMTFGIGVDYAVNMFQRYQLEGPGKIVKVIRETGGAVGLASYTTMVGYLSLLIASNQAFVSFGLLSILGEVTCMITALVMVTAWVYQRDLRRKVQP